MMLSSPYTCAQVRIVVDHFWVTLKADRYNAFNIAVSLGNTILCRFGLRYVAFSDSMEFAV